MFGVITSNLCSVAQAHYIKQLSANYLCNHSKGDVSLSHTSR